MRASPVTKTAPAWCLQDAKAQFSALVENAMRGVPQHVTRRGKGAVVVLSAHDFEALQRSALHPTDKPLNLVAHLLAIPKGAIDLSPLDVQPRKIDFS